MLTQLVIEVARMKEKAQLIHVLSDAEKKASGLRSFKIFEWEIASFAKTTLPQREPFLTMIYTINSSPLPSDFVCSQLFWVLVITDSVQYR